MRSDYDEIIAIHHAWINAEQRGDVDAMLSLCSADVRISPPNLPIIQEKNAVREFLERSIESTENINISNIHVEIGGSLAYKTARFITSSIQGNHLWVLRREESTWRILFVTWSYW